jgi:hypothetical protein
VSAATTVTTSGGGAGGPIVTSGSGVQSAGSQTLIGVGTSGAVTTSKDAAGAPATDTAPPALPTSLPPLVVVDRRGDHALAVFEDASWSFACMLSIDGGTWTADGLMAEQVATSSGQAVAMVGSMGAAISSADSSGPAPSTVAGTVPPGVTRVTLTFADGTVADATVTHGHYAAWYPGDLGAAPPTITMYDASGHQV